MGLFETTKNFVSGVTGEQDDEESGSAGIAEGFEDDVELEEDGFDDEFEEDDALEDEMDEEWDTAYRFAEDMLEPDGFANMQDFITKFMFYEVRKSPRYRDRIKNGSRTMEMVSSSMRSLDEARGGGESTDFGEMADKLQNADAALDAAESLSGKDDVVVQQALGIGSQLVENLGKRAAESNNPNVQSRVTESDREI
jgi:hypothetical protein